MSQSISTTDYGLHGKAKYWGMPRLLKSHFHFQKKEQDVEVNF